MIVRHAFDKWWIVNGQHVKEETELTLKRERLGVDAVFRKEEEKKEREENDAEL